MGLGEARIVRIEGKRLGIQIENANCNCLDLLVDLSVLPVYAIATTSGVAQHGTHILLTGRRLVGTKGGHARDARLQHKLISLIHMNAFKSEDDQKNI